MMKASVKAAVQVGAVQGLENGFDDRLGAGENVAIPEAQDAQAACSQEGVAGGVVGSLRHVLMAVELDDQCGLEADEVADVGAERALAAELVAVQLAAAEVAPEQALGGRGVVAQVAGEGGHRR